MSQGTRKDPSAKPAKPYADFPLFAHATGRWAKKIRGKMHYFGKWADPDAALDKYLKEQDDRRAGRTPRVSTDEFTVRDLVNRFLTAKKMRVESGELANRSFLDYYATCARVTACFGLHRRVADLAADDFERLRSVMAKGRGPVSLGNDVQRVRVLFKYGHDAGWLDSPVRFGPEFKRPSRKVLRKARHSKGPRMFEAAQLRKILSKANQPLQVMILLGINCGFGNADVAHLPIAAVDVKAGWINFPRPKTGIGRRVPLWPETVKAIKAWLAKRSEPKDERHAGALFVTKQGLSWAKETSDNPVSKEFSKLLKELKLDRPGLNFYALRHTFETIGGESLDQVAVDSIMGHAPASNDMASVYRERVTDERLTAVSDHVRKWLWPPKTKAKSARRKKAKPKAKWKLAVARSRLSPATR